MIIGSLIEKELSKIGEFLGENELENGHKIKADAFSHTEFNGLKISNIVAKGIDLPNIFDNYLYVNLLKKEGDDYEELIDIKEGLKNKFLCVFAEDIEVKKIKDDFGIDDYYMVDIKMNNVLNHGLAFGKKLYHSLMEGTHCFDKNEYVRIITFHNIFDNDTKSIASYFVSNKVLSQ